MVNKKPTDGAVIAPDTVEAPVYRPAPRQKTVERTGSQSEPFVRRWPEVRVGVCEFCGIMDKNVESQFQYKLCPHYRGMNLRCSYCPDSKDPDEVNGHTVLHVYEHPDNPDKFIICCDSYECSLKHQARFKRN
jgi:hypothetical protein